jgi:hypothetical protein
MHQHHMTSCSISYRTGLAPPQFTSHACNPATEQA